MSKNPSKHAQILVSGTKGKHCFPTPKPSHRLIRLSEKPTAINYLAADGEYAHRIPRTAAPLLVLELKGGKADKSDVFRWLAEKPAYRALSIVLLNSSEAIPIQRAKRKRAHNRSLVPDRILFLPHRIKSQSRRHKSLD